jgi:hypothetical protein
MNVTQVYKAVTKHAKQLTGLTSSDNIEETYRALIATVLQGSLADRGRVQHQVDILTKAQGAKYVPFLTGNLNQALRTLLETNKPLLDILKTLQPTQGTNINITQQNANMPTQGEALGTNEAVRLIDAKAAEDLLESGTLQSNLLGEHLEGQDLPEIIATKQQGSTDLQDAQRAKGQTPSKRREDDDINASPELT